jgi:hypothetical protein
MHNARLANPLDPIVKEIKTITKKRKKTDDDHEALARLEHAAGLYIDEDIGPYVPAENVHRCLVDAAKKSKLGKAVTQGVLITTAVNPLAYKGPRDRDGLWADKRFVFMASAKVGQQRVMRCRPRFVEWATSADGILDPEVLDPAELSQIAETAGSLIGLGDWRPLHGRFTAQVAFRNGNEK